MAHVCPIGGEKINALTVRVVATLIGITAIAVVFTKSYLVFLVLAYDFFVRGFGEKKYSPYRWLAIQVVNKMGIEEQLIPALPKRFAAKIGFAFSGLLFVFGALQWWAAFYVAAAVLLSCVVLEAGFGFCLGCEFYVLLQRFNWIKQ